MVLAVTKSDGDYIIEFDDGTWFSFDPHSLIVGCPPQLEATGRHQLLDHVLPRVLEHLGHLMVHAGAVCTSHGEIVFIGDTGAGKSSLVASFHAAGFEILSDDCVRLIIGDDGGVECVPTYRSLRLWPDSAEALASTEQFETMSTDGDKRRLHLPAPSTPVLRPTNVAAICVLASDDHDADTVRLSSLSPTRAVALLLAQCFRLDPTDAAATRRALDGCADLVERVPVVELGYPRDYGRLPEVRHAIAQLASMGGLPSVTPA